MFVANGYVLYLRQRTLKNPKPPLSVYVQCRSGGIENIKWVISRQMLLPLVIAVYRLSYN